MENEVTKRTWKKRFVDWCLDNKEVLIIGGGYAVVLGSYCLGLYLGAKATNEASNIAESILHRDGFMKYFDPNTGEEVSGARAKELVEAFYKKK